ncbi:hypothetical protein H6770_03925 [Candidatus Peribacteria bacterium]|nr:hypothetical protein [Candidatus Peribacteria bacterium]
MKAFVTYLFWPNPSAPSYENPKVILLFLICGALIVGSFAVKRWRKRLTNAVTKRLTKSYSPAMLWFGIVGAFLLVCRVEGISYLSMRLWWGLWFLGAIAFATLQWKLFRSRHYEIIPQARSQEDAKEKYLPKKKKR